MNEPQQSWTKWLVWRRLVKFRNLASSAEHVVVGEASGKSLFNIQLQHYWILNNDVNAEACLLLRQAILIPC